MRIAILGGTGDIGEGLALRWARDTDHEIVIGSRDADRAATAATTYTGQLQARGYDPSIDSGENTTACAGADAVVLAVPPYSVADAIEAVEESIEPSAILISPAVGIRSDDAGAHYHRPAAGSVTELVAETAPPEVDVAGAFHTLPAGRLQDLDDPLELDTVVVGTTEEVRERVCAFAEEIDGLEAFDGGPVENAPELEGVTPLMITLSRHNAGLHDVAPRFVTPDRF